MMEDGEQQILKLVVLGSSQSSKIAAINKIINRSGSADKLQFLRGWVKLQNRQIFLRIWTSGIKKYLQFQQEAQVRGLECLLFIYDVDKEDTFKQLNPLLNQAKKFGYDQVSKLLIAFKPKNSLQKISAIEGKKFAIQRDMLFWQISQDDKDQDIYIKLKTYVNQVYDKQLKQSEIELNDYYEYLITKFKQEKIQYDQCLFVIKKLLKEKEIAMKLKQKQQKLTQEVKWLYNKIRLLNSRNQQVVTELTVMKVKFQKILQSFNTKQGTNILNIFDFYEAEMLKIRENFAQKEINFEQKSKRMMQQCYQLENICQGLQTITNLDCTQRMDQISQQYRKYKLKYCLQDSIKFAESQLQGWEKKSHILGDQSLSQIMDKNY